MSNEKEAEEEKTPLYVHVAQVVLAALGLAGAGLHAFPLHIDPSIHTQWPITDASDIGWLALVIVAVLLPRISKLSIGSASVELQQVKRAATETKRQLPTVIDEYANLTQNWSTSTVIYVDALAGSSDDADRARLLRDYIRDRMGEAKLYLSDDPEDNVRIMLWLYDPNTRLLEFYYTNEEPPTKHSYRVGEGMLGKAFEDRRSYNEADVRSVPSYHATRHADPPYRAVLCSPIYIGDEPIGLLTADKKTAGVFSPAAEDIAKGLAAQCAFAIDQFRKAG